MPKRVVISFRLRVGKLVVTIAKMGGPLVSFRNGCLKTPQTTRPRMFLCQRVDTALAHPSPVPTRHSRAYFLCQHVDTARPTRPLAHPLTRSPTDHIGTGDKAALGAAQIVDEKKPRSFERGEVGWCIYFFAAFFFAAFFSSGRRFRTI